ncbi:MAG: aminotransferase class V-fold PLP-dependent enzyme [Nocardiaceae bacterium]|nr:aminotransferase class V-fold PLP-dependent enzyme [Nocardiaceae bacterium]
MWTLDDVRADAPACQNLVFLDSAGSSLPPNQVVETVVRHVRREAEVGGYRAANERLDDLAAVKTSIGRLINAPAESIALSDSASRSWSDFFYSVPLQPDDRILISHIEYGSNAIAALQRSAQTGATVEPIPCDPSGRIDLEAFERMLDERVKLVSLVHVPTNGGVVNPVRPVADLAHKVGALVLLDACQSAGQLSLDVAAMGVDALSATGRKWLRGPRGTGLLYVDPTLDLTPSRLDLHGATWQSIADFDVVPDASRFEFWEFNVAARLGLGAAVDYLLDHGPDSVYAAIAATAANTRAQLREIPGVTVHDPDGELAGIVSFSVAGCEGTEVRDMLAKQDITVTVSHRSSTLLDMSRRGLDSVVRASPHCFVSPDDIATFTRAVTDIARFQ